MTRVKEVTFFDILPGPPWYKRLFWRIAYEVYPRFTWLLYCIRHGWTSSLSIKALLTFWGVGIIWAILAAQFGIHILVWMAGLLILALATAMFNGWTSYADWRLRDE